MEKYTVSYRLVKIKSGAATQVDVEGREFSTFEDAHNYLGTIDPNEFQTYTILPIYQFKKDN